MTTVVLHVLGGGLVAGGNETSALALLQRNDRSVFDPVLVVLSPRRDAIAADFERLGIPIELCEYNPRRPWHFAARFARLTRSVRPQSVLCYSFSTVHVWTHLAATLGGAARRLTRVAAWPPNPRLHSRLAWVNRLGRPFCTAEIAVSQHVGRMLRVAGGYPAARIHVIPNGCDVEAINRRAVAARQRRPQGDALRILMVARMDDAKDQDTVICAMQTVGAQLPEARLQLAGDGERRPTLERLAADCGVSHLVEFLGTRRDVPELLGQADVFVLMSHTEGFPNVVIEAMAAGTPAIASDIPPCREILDGGSAGVLTPPRDPSALAEVLAELLTAKALRERLTAAAFERVRRRYHITRVVGEYEALLSGSPGRSAPA